MKMHITKKVSHDPKRVTFQVHKPEAAEDDYTGQPLVEFGNSDEAEAWCDKLGYEYVFVDRVAKVPAEYLKDIEAKADKLHREMLDIAKDLGLHFDTNVVYRASALWKDQPTHYAYFGDFGSVGRFSGPIYKDGTPESAREDKMRDIHQRLIYWAEALWELGFTLTFDKDGKHTVYGIYPDWVVRN